MDQDTYQVEAWITSDGSYVGNAVAAARADNTGEALHSYIRELLLNKRDGPHQITSTMVRRRLNDILQKVALDRVDWGFVRSSLARMEV